VRRLLRGEILWDTTKPGGTPCKLPDISRVKALGWSPRVPLETGLRNGLPVAMQRDWTGRVLAQRTEWPIPLTAHY
jgi:nucleoside-diphosphate-sugar epimerase